MTEGVVFIALTAHYLRNVQGDIKAQVFQGNVAEYVGISIVRIKVHSLEGALGYKCESLIRFSLLRHMSNGKPDTDTIIIPYVLDTFDIVIRPSTDNVGIVWSKAVLFYGSDNLLHVV